MHNETTNILSLQKSSVLSSFDLLGNNVPACLRQLHVNDFVQFTTCTPTMLRTAAWSTYRPIHTLLPTFFRQVSVAVCRLRSTEMTSPRFNSVCNIRHANRANACMYLTSRFLNILVCVMDAKCTRQVRNFCPSWRVGTLQVKERRNLWCVSFILCNRNARGYRHK